MEGVIEVGAISRWLSNTYVIVNYVSEDGRYCTVTPCDKEGVRKHPDAVGVRISKSGYLEYSTRISNEG